jgi:hypothetical protein
MSYKFWLFASLMCLVEICQGEGLPRPFAYPSSSEITASDLEWKNAKQYLSKEIAESKAVRVWKKDLYDFEAEWFAPIDIDENKRTREVLIASSYGGSGGRQFLLIRQGKNGEWRKLAAVHGAPIFIKQKPGTPSNLQVYYRNGDMWLLSYGYSGGKYRYLSESFLPRILVTECFYRRWQQLNLFLSAPGLKEAENLCPELTAIVKN